MTVSTPGLNWEFVTVELTSLAAIEDALREGQPVVLSLRPELPQMSKPIDIVGVREVEGVIYLREKEEREYPLVGMFYCYWSGWRERKEKPVEKTMADEEAVLDDLRARLAAAEADTRRLEYVVKLKSAYWIDPMNGYGWRLIETDCGAMRVCGEGDTFRAAIDAAMRAAK